MNAIAIRGKWYRDWLASHRVQLALCLRVTISAVLSLAASQLLGLPIALWTVLTAVILTQLSVGKSLRATTDYLMGTLGAAIYAGAVGTLIPHASGPSHLAALAIAVAPPALLAAVNPRFSAAPFTAVLVFLAPAITHLSPVASAVDRMVEVAVGGIVGLVVSLIVFPARAHDLAIAAAAHTLDLMAQSLPELLAKSAQPMGQAPLPAVQNNMAEAFERLETIVVEAKHERMTRLSTEPDQGVLLRTVRRLRHDLIIVDRATVGSLPAEFLARVGPRLARIGEHCSEYLHACAVALLARDNPPSMGAVAGAQDDYATEMAALRGEGFTRDFSADTAEHIFALGFALDQLRRDLIDLALCVAEFSASGVASISNGAETHP